MQHKARKRFGQNFLQDEGIIQNIIGAIHPRAGENMVEIGPGLGAITERLLPALGKLQVVELDRDVIPPLQRACAGKGELIVHQQDALKFDFSTLTESERSLRVVGNLPYNISTPLLFHLLEYAGVIRDMHFMLQKEVVDRMAAGPGNKHYGRLSVMLQYHCRVEKLFDVPPEAFEPAPKVDSAIVRLTPHPQPPVAVNSVAMLSKVVTQCFSQRRKTLRNNLKGLLEVEQIKALGISPTARAETLTLTQFALLSNQIEAEQQSS